MVNNHKPSLGILGIGHLATYTVTGLRRSGDDRRIILSPRNAQQAAKVAAEFDCEIAQDNQSLIDECDLILLAVRPFQLNDLLENLRFPKDKIVISAAAGVSLSQLREKADLPKNLALILPGVGAENSQGFVPTFPEITEVSELTDSLGKTIVLETEAQFDEAASMACLNGWMYRFYDEQIKWLIKNGVGAEDSRQIVLNNALSSAYYALGRPDDSLPELAAEIAKEGSFTKIGMDQLEAVGAFKQWTDALDLIKDKLVTNND